MDKILKKYEKLEDLSPAERIRRGWRGALYPWEIAELLEPDDISQNEANGESQSKEARRIVIENAIAAGDLKAEPAPRSDEKFTIISPYLQVKVYPENFVHWIETQEESPADLPEALRRWAFPEYKPAVPMLTEDTPEDGLFDFYFDRYAKLIDLQRERDEWDMRHPTSITEADIRDKKLVAIDEEIQRLKREMDAKVEEIPVEAKKRPGRRDLQVRTIMDVIAKLNYPPLTIPWGGKAKVMHHCLKGHPMLFTKDGFERAWAEARRRGMVEVDNPNQYRRR